MESTGMREDFEVRVTLLAVEAQTADRKALEAFWIHAKDPKLKRKKELLYITRELRPYISDQSKRLVYDLCRMNAAAFEKYVNYILPKTPRDVTFEDAVFTPKDLFGP
ncbi:unnamed protein product [Heligmosomoides polygyrus]|uniref:RGS domain-containing protein n=1 Tax=Heligmosomoides polygyrus TaxID=6339 RepID=A0A183FK55_HELPZ|nr:unnamed protein product [Heligmosomoides polygyrus]